MAMTAKRTRQHWPYPTSKKQLTHLGMLLGALLLVAGLGTGVWLSYQQRQPLSNQDIQLTASELASYASEAAMLVTVTTQQPLTASYRATYAKQLHTQIQTSKKTLAGKPTANDAAVGARQLLDAAERLDRLITSLPSAQDRQAAQRYTSELNQVSESIRSIGGGA